ncbi:hypothetical protein [Staphylococcus chromogenes]|uniref:hypothetical protein n=1 Tax=Staphylococcus chromogenes TaxID=46126 RepID=UPI003D7BF0BF
MRLSERVTFVTEGERKYNPKTSKTEVVTINHRGMPCNINPLKRERVRVEFGNLTRDISVVRVRGSIAPRPTKALVKGRKYNVVDTRYYHGITSVFVEEIS